MSTAPPDIAIRVHGSEASAELRGSLRSAVVRRSLLRTDSFELRVSSAGASVLPGPGDVLDIALGQPGSLVSVFAGHATATLCEIDEDGTTWTVRGLDPRHAAFRSRTVERVSRGGQERIQFGESDGAWRRGLEQLDGKVEGDSGWQDAPSGRRATPVRYGHDLISFSAELDHRAVPAGVTVRGWDDVAREPVEGTAGGGDEWSAAGGAAPEGLRGQVTLQDAGIGRREDARSRAQGVYRRLAEGWLRGRVALRARTGLAPGDILPLEGLGAPVDGDWRVHEVTHLWSPVGLQTRVEIARTGPS